MSDLAPLDLEQAILVLCQIHCDQAMRSTDASYRQLRQRLLFPLELQLSDQVDQWATDELWFDVRSPAGNHLPGPLVVDQMFDLIIEELLAWHSGVRSQFASRIADAVAGQRIEARLNVVADVMEDTVSEWDAMIEFCLAQALKSQDETPADLKTAKSA